MSVARGSSSRRIAACLGLVLGLSGAIARADDTSTVSPTPTRPVVFEGAIGMQMISRRLHYHEDVNNYLTPYTLPAGPALSVAARWFPGASFTRGLGAAFGVDLRYERSFGIESRAGGASFRDMSRVFEVQGLARLSRPRYELIGALGYGMDAFVFSSSDGATNLVNPRSPIPSVDYRYIRIGLEARLMPFERVHFLLGVAGLAVLDPGPIGSNAWFPHAGAGGTELRARVAYLLPHHVELRLGLRYRRYFLDMHSQLGDPYVAGGAVDHHVALEAAAAYRY